MKPQQQKFKKVQKPQPEPQQQLTEEQKQQQWDTFDQSLEKMFGKKKGDGSNRG